MRTRFYPTPKKPTFRTGFIAALILVASAFADADGAGWLTIASFVVFYFCMAGYALKGHNSIIQAQSDYRDALISAGEWTEEKEQIFFDMWNISAQADIKAAHDARPADALA